VQNIYARVVSVRKTLDWHSNQIQRLCIMHGKGRLESLRELGAWLHTSSLLMLLMRSILKFLSTVK
jgi:hypothetical protein